MSNKKTIWRIIAILTALLLVAWFVAQYIPMGTDHGTPPPTGDAPKTQTGQMRHDGELTFLDADGQKNVSIQIEIAGSEQERTAGLMGRTRIAEKEGMLFLFDTEEERAFWMANTPLPLDILFVNSNRTIVKIHHHTQPYSEESLPSNSPAQFVVEVNAGFCDRFGITEGQQLTWNRY